MGCTVHAHIEVKKDGTWYHFGAPRVERDYKLFAAMTGERLGDIGLPLRDRIRPVARIHGLPADASVVTLACYEQDKGYGVHGAAVLTADDLAVLQDRLYALFPDVPRTGIDRLDLEYGVFRTYITGGTLSAHKG